jgi:hypothetical protein
MLAQHTIGTEAPQVASPPQQLAMHVLKLVTGVMVDDVGLAEQLRTAAMGIWLAAQRTHRPGLALVAWRDIQRGEQQLRRLTYRALRRGYLRYQEFDEVMTLLHRVKRQRLYCEATSRMV